MNSVPRNVFRFSVEVILFGIASALIGYQIHPEGDIASVNIFMITVFASWRVFALCDRIRLPN